MEKEDVIEIVALRRELGVEGRPTMLGLAINGEVLDVDDAYFPHHFRNNTRHDLSVKSDVLAERLLQRTLTSFPENLASITFELPAKEYKTKVDSEEPQFAAMSFKETGETVFTFTSAINVYDWIRYYSFSHYLESLRWTGLNRYPGFIANYGESGDRDDALYEKGALEVYMRFPLVLTT